MMKNLLNKNTFILNEILLNKISNIINVYLINFPNELNKLQLLKEQIKNKELIGNRKNFTGHITSSAFLYNQDTNEILFINHKGLNKILIPGGHYENKDNENIINTCKREVFEEVGVDLNSRNGFLIDIDSHKIPINIKKNEKEHFHHDFRYLFKLKNKDFQNIKLDINEVNNFSMINLDDIENQINTYDKNIINKIKLVK